ncbi:dockerin type I domain-containing protein [Pseudobacteroides cellulosolvens]|uniref:dockerin type I domain-containing protein n=1 Tax=Pseudobacteroides cellulosolvens TaxID=35825 RepID=UPI0006804579|nr:dockerin type I domain-containing protein [Pseudobacteroides cellulosolvens]
MSGTKQFPIRQDNMNKYYSINGSIKPSVDVSNTALNEGFKVSIRGTSLSATTDSNGNFTIDSIPEGTNTDIIITKSSFLTRNIALGKITSTISVKSPIVMWAGDIEVNNVQDGAINMLDVIEVAKLYNAVQNDLKYNQKADLNRDGRINLADIVLIAKNFNKTSKDYLDIQ